MVPSDDYNSYRRVKSSRGHEVKITTSLHYTNICVFIDYTLTRLEF